MAEREPVTVCNVTGAGVLDLIDGLAELRLQVFRDWPYLYDGTEAYERWYLERFAAAEGAVVVAAFAGDALVGAATAAPLASEHSAFVAPFAERGLPVERVFYLAESVLLPAYRGRGIGHRFFDGREAAATARGCTHAAFCAVVRPEDHSLRPKDHSPLDPFWRRRGYAPVPGMLARFSWRDVDMTQDTSKPLQFWWRALR